MLKPISESELINIMEKELVKNANSQDFSSLDKAVDYLNSAIDMLETSGFISHADALLNVLTKIAAFEKRKVLIDAPSLVFIREMDASNYDFENKGIWQILGLIQSSQSEMLRNKYKAILNDAARSKTGKDIIANVLNKYVEQLNERDFKKILEDNYLSESQAGQYLLSRPDLRKNLKFNVKDYVSKQRSPKMFGDEEISEFVESELPTPQTVAAARYNLKKLSKTRKPKNPTKISDRHTKNLDSNKMIKNLKDHGTVFNMADSNFADDLLNEDIDFEDEQD